MDNEKNNEENNIDEKYDFEYDGTQEYIVVSDSPLTIWDYVVMIFVLMIPIFNLVMLFYWSFSGGININRKNFARAILIYMAVLIIGGVLLGGTIIGFLRYYF